MKIAITGHTRGLGNAFYKHLKEKGHDIKGYSRSTGYDLTDITVHNLLVNEIEDCDLFINNAHVGTMQMRLCETLLKKWKGIEGKAIWNITSTSALTSSKYHPIYTAEKAALDKFTTVYQSDNSFWPKVTLLRFATVDTDTQRHSKVPKLEIADALTTVDFLIALPKHVQVLELSLKNVVQDIRA